MNNCNSYCHNYCCTYFVVSPKYDDGDDDDRCYKCYYDCCYGYNCLCFAGVVVQDIDLDGCRDYLWMELDEMNYNMAYLMRNLTVYLAAYWMVHLMVMVVMMIMTLMMIEYKKYHLFALKDLNCLNGLNYWNYYNHYHDLNGWIMNLLLMDLVNHESDLEHILCIYLDSICMYI